MSDVTIDETDTDDARRAVLERRRELITQRLVPLVDAIEREREAVVGFISKAARPMSAPLEPDRLTRGGLVLAGAAIGGAVMALGTWLVRRRRARNRPINVMSRAIKQLATPRRPSRIGQIAAEAAGSLLLSTLSDLARSYAQRRVEAAANPPRATLPPRQEPTASDTPPPPLVEPPSVTIE